jgi:hypothetical protein
VLAPGRRIGKPLSVGLLCALLLLTRIAPASIAYASIAILLLHGWRQKLIALSVGLVPLVAWGVFAQQYFGHVLPMSMLVKMSSPNHVSALRSARIGLEYFWESTKYSLSAASRFNVLQLRARTGLRDTVQIGLMGAALAVSVLGLLKSWRAGATSRAVVALAAFDAAGVAANVLMGVAMAGKSDDIYYTVWYVYDLPVLVAINCGFAIAWIQAQLGATRFSRATTAVLALACVTYFVGDIAWYVRLRPYDASDDAKFAGTAQIKKFEAASWFLANVAPANPDYKVAAYSAGALGFYLSDHVINLDGLANDAAGMALISTQSSVGYAEQVKPDYFIEICPGERQFDNLERLHVVPFPRQRDYCIDRFRYAPASQRRAVR